MEQAVEHNNRARPFSCDTLRSPKGHNNLYEEALPPPPYVGQSTGTAQATAANSEPRS